MQVSGGGSWLALDLGLSHVCAIKASRQLFCWVRPPLQQKALPPPQPPRHTSPC